jgi:hypothetical protein
MPATADTPAQTPISTIDPNSPYEETQGNGVYQNSQYGFELEYPSTIRPFSEIFIIDEAEHVHYCRWFDIVHQSYADSNSIGRITLDPELFSDLQCSIVKISFDEYAKRYVADLAPRTARNSKLWKIPSMNGVAIYGLSWEIPVHGLTPDSPQIGWSPVFYFLVEPPQNVTLAGRALRFVSSGGVRSCPNSYCEFGETPVECPADCKEDWGAIANRIFESIKFITD